jgi:hypothetical protein
VVGVLANNLWRISGVNNGPDINLFTLQPFINFNIPPGWSITTAPIITADWSAPEGQKWTLPVGIGLGNDSAQNGVGIQIEDHDGAVAAAITDESTARLGNDRDAMSDLLAWNVGDGLAGFGVDHHRMRAPRNI